MQPIRLYSGAAPLTKELATERIMDILEGFSKVDQSKIALEASFSQDLGLDSLDVVDVVMEMESEFSIEIPDEHADQLKTVSQAVDYIMSQHDAC
ncbi:hypothetical protein BABINDRAFT_163354 [Babjeviella inositovora NRRL Y-12698]|uniref:Acyl carrier protein n=1 Tax=Babjeviella inositovora NRRL Y-12698 TaxID=984486 RepID=A0A1E3QKW5_9ASCO|nr:uncharacterized protein BABINDRAFT_163354 [Babjeviella inositovora NRRL Y-12698]ODQ77637.1 hypothetical protein BABINDRAFT_163354 [Babjeviella inositovora NRRL Y-12698]